MILGRRILAMSYPKLWHGNRNLTNETKITPTNIMDENRLVLDPQKYETSFLHDKCFSAFTIDCSLKKCILFPVQDITNLLV